VSIDTDMQARARVAGPVALSDAHRAAVRPLALHAVALAPEGQLGAWQELNREATIPHCIANVHSSGVLDNLRRIVGRSDAPFRGFWFADTDLYKTLEAIGWDRARPDGSDHGAFLDEAIELLESCQEDDGCLDSWIQVDRPDERWQDLTEAHEMYCAGHLIQAAVAVARGTGRDDLLRIARRCADLLVRQFGDGGVEGYDGHPEIETALVELHRETGEESYLRLAARFLDLRGKGLLGEGRFGRSYFQDHVPVRQATEVTGHSVRQLYLLAGVVDVYLHTGDADLLAAAERLWEDAFERKTYVTGAHGSRHRDEAYGDPYELPPDRAYAETCAAIASLHFNWRMLLATGAGRYAEEVERALYNAIACSTALDGRHFYSNPLQLRAGHDGSREDAPSERLSWYACACCPPNLARLVASLHHYVATCNDRGVRVHLPTAARLMVPVPGARDDATVAITTDYPWDRRIVVDVDSPDAEWELSLRIPAWCEEPSLTVAGEPAPVAAQDGYARIARRWNGRTRIELNLPMPVRAVAAHPRVDAVRGSVALARGPLVYCLEQQDQAPGVHVDDVSSTSRSSCRSGSSSCATRSRRCRASSRRRRWWTGADQSRPCGASCSPSRSPA
jgi:uncharacterized protein